MGHRAWFAWQCLDRDDHGRPPSYRSLEEANELSNNSLRKLIYDRLKRPGWDQLEKLARALKTTPEWLQREQGVGPTSRWPVPPRPDPTPAKESPATIPLAAQAEFERDTKKLGKSGPRVGRQRAR